MEQPVDVFEIIEAVVDEKLQFGDDTQLFAHLIADQSADVFGHQFDMLQRFRGFFRRENAQVAPGQRQVTGNAHHRDTDQQSLKFTAEFFQEEFCHLFLEETGNFILTG